MGSVPTSQREKRKRDQNVNESLHVFQQRDCPNTNDWSDRKEKRLTLFYLDVNLSLISGMKSKNLVLEEDWGIIIKKKNKKKKNGGLEEKILADIKTTKDENKLFWRSSSLEKELN